MPTLRLDSAPTRFRTHVQRGLPALAKVDVKNRVIHRFSVVTRGEALGHGMWLDAEFVDDVASLSRNAGAKGLKSRFTHPGLSSDGTGKALGRARAFFVDGDQVLADLHLLKAASRSPDGDLAGYVMALAQEDPEIFGTSIVFIRDRVAERAFQAEHTEDGVFESPDPLNVENLPHARAKEILAVDVVDDPAANPGGFFDASGGIAANAEGILAYALGLTDNSPAEGSFGGVHPERVRQFVARFLSNRGLVVHNKEEAPVATKKEEEGVTTVAPPEKKVATLAALEAAFPEDPKFVLESLKAERTMDEASSLWQQRRIEKLELENLELANANEKLTEDVANASPPDTAEGADPVPFGGSTDGGSAGDFMALARDLRDKRHPSLSAWELKVGKGMKEALRAASIKYPAAAAEYRASNGIRSKA